MNHHDTKIFLNYLLEEIDLEIERTIAQIRGNQPTFWDKTGEVLTKIGPDVLIVTGLFLYAWFTREPNPSWYEIWRKKQTARDILKNTLAKNPIQISNLLKDTSNQNSQTNNNMAMIPSINRILIDLHDAKPSRDQLRNRARRIIIRHFGEVIADQRKLDALQQFGNMVAEKIEHLVREQENGNPRNNSNDDDSSDDDSNNDRAHEGHEKKDSDNTKGKPKDNEPSSTTSKKEGSSGIGQGKFFKEAAKHNRSEQVISIENNEQISTQNDCSQVRIR